MKAPAECRTLEEVRAEIDRIDRGIIAVIAERAGYVKAAAAYKLSEDEVEAPDRFAAMLRARRSWAENHGLDPAVVESVYRELVAYFIREEKEHWRAR